MASAEESQLAETRKRKIDAVLGLLDGHTESSSPKSVVAIAGSPLSLGLPTTPRPEGRQTTRYNPWDADACSKRLASFRPWAHHDQRSPINAYLLARHGWRLVPDDIRRVSAARLSVTAPGTPQQRPQTPTLTSPATPNNPPGTPTAFSAESPGSRVKARYCTIECVGCGARVVCDTNSQVAGVSRKLAAKYGERLMGDDPAHGHRKDCLWRTKPCVGNILHVRGVDQKQSAIAAFTSRQQALEQCQTLPTLSPLIDTDEDEALTQAEKLAMVGWTISRQSGVGMLSCGTCHRRTVVERPGGIAGLAAQDKAFDVLKEHHDYCSWVSSQSQGGKSPAWRLVYDFYLADQAARSSDTAISFERQAFNIAKSLGFRDTQKPRPRRMIRKRIV